MFPTTLPTAFDGEALLHTVATAMVRLSHRRHPGDPVYEDVVQRAFDQLVLLSLRRGQQPPGSVPDMVAWAAHRPLHEWPLDLLDAEVADHQHLVDADTWTPTQFCLEWALAVADPAAEKFENYVMTEAMDACRAARSPESYTRLRRLFITRPVLTVAELAELSGDIDLVPVLDLVQHAYEPAPASYQHDGRLFTCRRCRCLLNPTTAGLRCELDRCLAEGNTAIGQTLHPHTGGGVRLLRRPLRVFITSPGLAETDLEQQLAKLGLQVYMWPEYDAFDLLVKLPGGRVWAIDVKDRANPALLGRSMTPFRTSPAHTDAFLVVPQYRLVEREDYQRVFRRHLPASLRNTTLLTDKQLLNKTRAVLRTARTTDEESGDA